MGVSSHVYPQLTTDSPWASQSQVLPQEFNFLMAIFLQLLTTILTTVLPGNILCVLAVLVSNLVLRHPGYLEIGKKVLGGLIKIVMIKKPWIFLYLISLLASLAHPSLSLTTLPPTFPCSLYSPPPFLSPVCLSSLSHLLSIFSSLIPLISLFSSKIWLLVFDIKKFQNMAEVIICTIPLYAAD